jgi:diguanylate cyclase (GGDEF)-like protein
MPQFQAIIEYPDPFLIPFHCPMPITESDLAALRASRLFAPVAEEILRQHLDGADSLELATDETLLVPGQNNDSLYVLLSGQLAILLDDPDATQVASVGPGECVGEQSIVDNRRFAAFVVARAPSRLFRIPPDRFRALMFAQPLAALTLVDILSERKRLANALLQENMSQQLRTIDGLTGLHNRQWMEEMYPRLLDRAKRDAQPVSLIVLDIYCLSALDYEQGQQTRDRVLQHFARLAEYLMRPTDRCVRHGGWRFCVLLCDSDAVQAARAAERLRVAVQAAPVVLADGSTVPISVSCGVAQWLEGLSLEELLAAAASARKPWQIEAA